MQVWSRNLPGEVRGAIQGWKFHQMSQIAFRLTREGSLRAKNTEMKRKSNCSSFPGCIQSLCCMCPLASSHSLAFTGIRLVKPRVSPRFPHSARIKNYLGWQTKCWFVLMFVLINQLSPPAWLQLQGQEVMSWRAMQSLIKTNKKSVHKFTPYFHILVPHFWSG